MHRESDAGWIITSACSVTERVLQHEALLLSGVTSVFPPEKDDEFIQVGNYTE
jgi:hypothetical protein